MSDSPPAAPPSRSSPPASPRRRLILPTLFVVALFAALWLRRPDSAEVTSARVHVFHGAVMGTSWTVKVVAASADPGAIKAAAAGALAAVDAAMSTYKPHSELSRLNRQPVSEPMALSPALYRVLRAAAEVSKRSGGAFDVTVAPLVDAFGFGPEAGHALPDEATVQRLRALVGWSALRLADTPATGPTATRMRAGLRVDLSAIAKGFGADQAAAALDALGVDRYLVEVGGEVRARGLNPDGQPWQLGIERPDSGTRQAIAVVGLDHGAMATSGDYRNYREVAGRRLSHTIDPRTGWPITHHLASVTVLADTCMTADAWATALDVLGPKDGLDLAERLGLAAYMLVRTEGGFEPRATPAFRAWSASAGSAGVIPAGAETVGAETVGAETVGAETVGAEE